MRAAAASWLGSVAICHGGETKASLASGFWSLLGNLQRSEAHKDRSLEAHLS